MADQIQVFMSSRRTVMSGEVVTFAAGFEPWDSAFGVAYRATGPFDVSASRDAVMVHRAECKSAEEAAALIRAVSLAEQVRAALAPHWRGGHPSQYPDEPTLCSAACGVAPSDEWAEVERVRDLPEVDEALLNFKDDCTGDNAAMVVRAVMRATRGVQGIEGDTK